MALQPPPLSGADRIRSLQTDDDIFNAFDAYPWTKDKSFLSGLSAILGPQNSSSSSSSSSSSAKASPADMAIHARIFYYAQRIGVQIDFARYTAWLARNSDHIPPQVLPDEYLASPPPSSSSSSPSSKVTGAATTATESLLPWQEAAPKADLYVDRRAGAAAAAGEPSYPVGFAEMLQLLSEGKEIPGIRQIPNTVARDASVKPIGVRAAPRKPWEKEAFQRAVESSLPEALDTEFPSLDTDSAGPVSPVDGARS